MLWPTRFLKEMSLKVWRTKQETLGDLCFFVVEAPSAVCLCPKEMIIFSNDLLILCKLALVFEVSIKNNKKYRTIDNLFSLPSFSQWKIPFFRNAEIYFVQSQPATNVTYSYLVPLTLLLECYLKYMVWMQTLFLNWLFKYWSIGCK